MTNKAVRQYEARMWRAASTKKENPYPEEWAVYDIESGVRLKYAESKEQAIRLATIWNDGKVPSKELAKAESARRLKELLKPGDTVQTILRNVSRSGMSRRISCVISRDGEVKDITWDVARVNGESVKGRAGYVQDVGIAVGGCGMDMGFNLVYNLSRTLFPDGFVCSGESCPSNDHHNVASLPPKQRDAMRRENFKGQIHKGDGGYALKQRWL